MVACVYCTPASCSSAFLDDFLFFVDSYHLLLLSVIVCGDFKGHVNKDCTDERKFLDLLDSCNVVQSVNKLTHLHGHILDLILSPSDSNFVCYITVGISDHALVNCHLAFACPALPEIGSISYRRYHKIDMQSPASTADDLYD